MRGTIDGSSLKLKIETSELSKNNHQQYLISGYSLVDGSNKTTFKGIITLGELREDSGTLFGTYDFDEEQVGKHSGKFVGKLLFNFVKVAETKQIKVESFLLKGDWTNYDATLSFKTILEK